MSGTAQDVRGRLLASEMAAVAALVICALPYVVIASRFDRERTALMAYVGVVVVTVVVIVVTAAFPIYRLTAPIVAFFGSSVEDSPSAAALVEVRARSLNLPLYFTLTVLGRYYGGALAIVLYMWASGFLTFGSAVVLLLRGWVAVTPGVVFLFFVCEHIVQPVRQSIALLCRNATGAGGERVIRVSIFARFLLVSLVLVSFSLAAVDLLEVARLEEGLNGGRVPLRYAVAIAWDVGVSVILTLVISTLAARSIALPLRRASSLMEAVGQGDLHLRVDVLTSDETASLGEAFNQMVDKFQQSQLELRAANEEIIALNRDLERNVQERTQALRLEATKSAVILQSIADGVMVFDQGQRVVLANTAVQSMLGLSGQAIINKHVQELVKVGNTPEERDRSLALLTGVLMRMEDNTKAPVYLKFKLGNRTMSASLAPISEQSLELCGGFVAVFRDITEEETAVELGRLNAELLEADRMRSQFLATMSHELRSPLNSIIGYCQVLLRGIDGPMNSEQQEDVNRIMQSGQNLLAIINDILDLSKIDAGRLDIRLSPVDVRVVIRTSMQSIEPLARRRGLRLESDAQGELPLVWADEDRLRQVMLNLLSNAVKFTREGFVRMEARDSGQAQVQITVVDSGVGIDASDHQAIFDEFYQVDSSRTREFGGTGLGLAITKRLVNLMGGNIWVDSQIGRGSRFTFYLPVYGATEQSVEVPVPVFRDLELSMDTDPTGDITPLPGQAAPRLLLAIDDDPEVIDLMKRFLEEQGFRIKDARTAHEGLDLSKRLLPNVITLDRHLPDGSGLELLKKLKQDTATCDIPVVMISVEDALEEISLLGAAAQLRKPVRRELLVGTLRRLKIAATLDPLAQLER